jgi:hypothetical protein
MAALDDLSRSEAQVGVHAVDTVANDASYGNGMPSLPTSVTRQRWRDTGPVGGGAKLRTDEVSRP